MKIKQGFELRKVGDEYVVITVGDAINSFNGMIKLNSTAVFIWEQLLNGIELGDLIKVFSDEFSVDMNTATKDVNSFIDNIKEISCFDE